MCIDIHLLPDQSNSIHDSQLVDIVSSLFLCCHSMADTYSDGLGNLDFERSQLGSGMSQRGAAKRLINALHAHAQRTNQKQFDLQTIRSVADRLNIKVSHWKTR